MALLRNGVAIILVPLHGLGSDQVEKANLPSSGVEAYYVSEHKNADASALRKRLHSYSLDEAEEVTIILFVSPSSLSHESPWFINVFSTLARRDLISIFCIDEAHSLEQAGRSFRTEFITAGDGINLLREMMPRDVPVLAMSASLRDPDIKRITKTFGKGAKPTIMHGNLTRRGTMFTCKVSGQSSKTLKSSAEEFLAKYPDKQQLWYSNSATKAEESMLEGAELMLGRHVKRGHADTTCQSFTGADGIMMKAATMDAFTSYSATPEQGKKPLPKIQILTATSSANCGISSNDLNNAMHDGLPPSLYELLQEMGRVDRKMNSTPGTCSYEIHISFNSCLSLFKRIMTNKSGEERMHLLGEMNAVLKLLMNWKQCYHSTIETYFEVNPSAN